MAPQVVLNWSRFVVERACCVFFTGFLVVIILAGTGGALLAAGGTQIDGGTSKFVIQGSTIAQRGRAVDGRYNGQWDRRSGRERKSRELAAETSVGSKQSITPEGRERELLSFGTGSGLSLTLLYESRDGATLLTESRLKEVIATERALLEDFSADFGLSGLADDSFSVGDSLSCPKGGTLLVDGYDCTNGYGLSPDDQSYQLNQEYAAPP